MKAHRQMVNKYKAAWLRKLTEKKPSAETLQIVKAAERQLDVFNLNIARQQV
jgi:hypothetical protein